MPRPHRLFIPNVSAHLIQRGNNRMQIFSSHGDHIIFLELLKKNANRHSVEINAFVLMTNHYHLLATPTDEIGIPLMMKRLNGDYTRYFNRRHERIGTLWNGRYRGLLIHDERYWLTCLRYIEQNPLRAGMTNHPGDYAWSSYKVHAFGHGHQWLKPHPLYLSLGRNEEERQAAYRALHGQLVPDEEAALVRGLNLK